MRKSLIFVVFVSMLIIASASVNVFGATYYVSKTGNDSNDGTTWTLSLLNIKTALSKCVSGDSVWAAAGIYIEGSTLEVKEGISLYGGFEGTETNINQRNISLYKTIIDGDESHRCVTNYGHLDGVYIQNGYSADGGGGIRNILGGVVTKCVITGNSASSGGGVHNSGKIMNCTISKNRGDHGAGVDNNGLLLNSIISGNTGATNSTPGVMNSGSIINCTIVGNSSIYNPDFFTAGGVYNYGTVTNSIIWKNYPHDCYSYSSSSFTDIPSMVSYSCLGETDGRNNNIRANPQFVNISSDDPLLWDLHLKPDSPCIDMGDINAIDLPSSDYEGNSRPGNDAKVCMGAYESDDSYIPGIPSAPAVIYVSPFGDGSAGSDWNTAFKTITNAIQYANQNPNLNGDLYEIRIAEGLYKEDTLIIFGETNLSGGWSGNPVKPEEQDINKYKTIVDGNKTLQCIKNYGVIDGLYIQNGKSGYDGAGVFNHTGIVRNCKISGNTGYAGGGAANIAGTIINCTISGNSGGPTPFSGGGLFNSNGGKIINCTISNNSAESGGGVCNHLDGIVENSIISDNFASGSGGGIRNYKSTVINCIVSGNTAKNDGGGIYSFQNSSVINCNIRKNISEGGNNGGGGVFNSQGSIITNSTISENTAKYNGGGVRTSGDCVTNCLISSNSSNYIGGISIYRGQASNCVISGNSSLHIGGADNSSGCTMTNCTITGNSSIRGCSGLSNSGIVKNSIIWKNSYKGISNDSYSISQSCFIESDETNGNINSDPLFNDVSTSDSIQWDLHLQAGSPCIDSGTTATLTQDINGIQRPQGAGWDMGAYEFFFPATGDVNYDGKITNMDTAILREYLCGLLHFSSSQRSLADINNDNKIDVSDIVFLINLISKSNYSKTQ